MFSILTSKIFGGLSVVLLLALGICWLGWSHTSDKYKALQDHFGTTLAVLRIASDNSDLKAKDAPGQIVALGESIKRFKIAIKDQNDSIDRMAEEAVRLRAEASKLQEIADKAKAQRQAAVAKLSDLSITPGTRDDCMTLLQEANDALDLIREAGL